MSFAATTSSSPSFVTYGNAVRFSFTKSITIVSKTCEYRAAIKFNAPKAKLPVVLPLRPELCNPTPDPLCENKSCLAGISALYSLGLNFYRTTGFDHVALDYYPCGHPPMQNFEAGHFDFHMMRINPGQRERMGCDLFPSTPACDWPGSPPPGSRTQSDPSGRKFFIMGRVEGGADSGKLANMPENFTVEIDSALQGMGLHAFDHTTARLVDEWADPMLVIGSYDGGISFWEPMFPYTFANGTTDNFYHANATYVQQTISSLPSYWSMSYSNRTQVTTVTIKGKANGCVPDLF